MVHKGRIIFELIKKRAYGDVSHEDAEASRDHETCRHFARFAAQHLLCESSIMRVDFYMLNAGRMISNVVPTPTSLSKRICPL